jgi:arabinogalactan endo-1,4-beta-galactosidase
MKVSRIFWVAVFSLGLHFVQARDFARGADIGWLSEMENSGRKFYNTSGTEMDLLDILKDYCINSIRLRVWVNPANGWSGKDDVLALASRAHAKGFRLMIDFHYSDEWADPGKQFKPAAWGSYNVTQLSQAVYDHTYDVLSALKNADITPEWVQVGNETNDGMLWPEGRASQGGMANYAAFVKSGHQAVKAVFPNAMTLVHVANGFDNGLFRWNIGGLIGNGAEFDGIAMSLYPDLNNWQQYVTDARSNMDDLHTRYSKPIMVSEIGMSVSLVQESRSFIESVITQTLAVADEQGLGVFWWEPQAYNWRGYTKVAWTNDGRPTEAMEGFNHLCLEQAPVVITTLPELEYNVLKLLDHDLLGRKNRSFAPKL